jgi:hypothetical protein
MMCIAELGWPVVLEVSGLSQDRIYQMTNPRAGRPDTTAAIALDRAMKAAGKEPLCILTHSQLSGARSEGHATHLQHAVCEMSQIDKLLDRGLSRADLDERVRGLTAIIAKSTHLLVRAQDHRDPAPSAGRAAARFRVIGGVARSRPDGRR